MTDKRLPITFYLGVACYLALWPLYRLAGLWRVPKEMRWEHGRSTPHAIRRATELSETGRPVPVRYGDEE